MLGIYTTDVEVGLESRALRWRMDGSPQWGKKTGAIVRVRMSVT